MLAAHTSDRDPLAIALLGKARSGGPGRAESRPVASGAGWRVVDVVCTSGPTDRPFAERQTSTTISLVLSGSFVYRSDRGTSFMSSGALLLGNEGEVFECSHEHGEGDRCLSFQFEGELFERLARDVGAPRAAFDRDRLPPARALAPIAARAEAALERPEAFEEIALELAGRVVRTVSREPIDAPPPAGRHADRIARVLRRLGARGEASDGLDELARIAGLSRFHFLRTFKAVTGVTPHQWVLRARLRDAARRLVGTRDPVTAIALDVGFEDLSNFIRTFRAEFGVSPRRYRAGGC